MVQSLIHKVDSEIVDVAPCEIAIIKDHGILNTVVGSGVSVCFFNSRKRIAGMNHFVLPRTDDTQKATGRYGNAALIGLLSMFARENAAESLEAYIAGGAYCDTFEIDTVIENIRIAWKFLLAKEIPIVSQYIGGYCCREVSFDLAIAAFKVNILP
jgi:chemotaxis protein CheD